MGKNKNRVSEPNFKSQPHYKNQMRQTRGKEMYRIKTAATELLARIASRSEILSRIPSPPNA